MREKQPYILLLFAVFTLLASCMPAEYVVPEQSGDAPPVVYPVEFRASHRIILQVNDKEYDFIGYMTKGDGKIRAIGFGEMGGKLFDLVVSEGGSEILLKPDGMGEKPLLDGVLEDIRYLYGGAPTGAEGGKVVRRVEFSDYRLFPGWDKLLPSVTVLRNLRWGYILRIELLKFETPVKGQR